jgi:peptide-methionine (S)-S-oxide reductase
MKRPLILIIAGALLIALTLIPWARTGERVPVTGGLAKATFAGGCFWCMEPPFEKLAGVKSVTSGYTGGHKANPTYNEVSWGGTGHLEAVEVVYDPAVVSYDKLLEVFWTNVDPENGDGQFCDFGEQNRSAIFVHDAEQKRLADASIDGARKSRRWVRFATQVYPAKEFYVAEGYHQDYYRKNPLRYRFYRAGCKRDERLELLRGSKP